MILGTPWPLGWWAAQGPWYPS